MAINSGGTGKKKPQRNVAKRATASSTLMGNQDTVAKGDSKAVRTERSSFSTTKEVLDAITEEAYKRRMSRSQLIEEAIKAYLNLE